MLANQRWDGAYEPPEPPTDHGNMFTASVICFAGAFVLLVITVIATTAVSLNACG